MVLNLLFRFYYFIYRETTRVLDFTRFTYPEEKVESETRVVHKYFIYIYIYIYSK